MASVQTTGYIIDHRTGEKILLLVRGRVGKSASHRSLKLRKSGADGTHFCNEEIFLNSSIDRLNDLKNGKVVQC